MADGAKVTICLRLPDALHDQIIKMQAKHLLKTGEQLSRNTIIVNILSRYAESGRPVQL